MLIIKNGILVTPSGEKRADLLIKGKKIDEISSSIYYKSADVYDATDCLIFAGFIDAHTHICTEIDGIKTSDSFPSATKAAIAGGTTSIIDFALQQKGDSLCEAFGEWQNKTRNNCSCDYSCHMTISDWNERTKNEISELTEKGVTSYKVFMANDTLMMTDEDIYDVMCEIKKHGAILLVHCESEELVKKLTEENRKNGNKEPCFHALSRPDFTEASAVARYCEIAKREEVDVNIVHLSSALGLSEALKARERGQSIRIETCPQYLTLDESVYSLPNFEASKYVCSPPLRGYEDIKALWTAIGEDKIDSISTDHCSYNFELLKELGMEDFSKIPSGLPGIEHRASLIYTYGVEGGKITKEQMSALLSENIAKQFGLYPQKGTLSVGSDADIVIWDKNASFIVSAEEMEQECDYTPYEGIELTGKPKAVFLRGELVYDGKEITKENSGIFLERKARDI